MTSKLLRPTCLLILCGVLVAGLWPFHAPKNQVRWLSSGAGIRFGDYGSITGAGTFRAKADTPCSLEIWLKPKQADYSGTILAFYLLQTHVVSFDLRQSLGDLVVQRTNLDELHHARRSNIYVDDLFSHAKLVFVTISSGPEGTAVYADGSLVKKSRSFRFSRQNLTGQFIVGNAPATTDTWSGQLKGFAVYDRELTVDDVSRHYANWTRNEQADLAKNEAAGALYLFDEGKGTLVHNRVDSTTDLLIPDRFFVLRQQFLERPWDEFYPGWRYWKDVGVNVVGFIPFGFVFSVYFSAIEKIKRPTWLTIALGFAVSLTIEVLQAFLPTRDSGITDLITNTLGTALGATLWGLGRKACVVRPSRYFNRFLCGERKEELKLVEVEVNPNRFRKVTDERGDESTSLRNLLASFREK
jgi:hypothetical protein